MPKTYMVIGSYVEHEHLDPLIENLKSTGLPEYTILIARQLGDLRTPRSFALWYNRLINAAFSDPECQYVWILNDDILPRPGCLAKTQAIMEADPTIGCIFPTEVWLDKDNEAVTALPPPCGEGFVPEGVALTTGPESILQVFAGFACALISRESWADVGPMDVDIGMGYCEDLDWGIRCWAAGYRIVNYRRATFLHARGATYGHMVEAGEMEPEAPGDAALVVKARYPWLWEGETAEDMYAKSIAAVKALRDKA